MKLSEMNAHQKEAYRHIANSMSEWVAGLENTMEDCEEGSEEYEAAKSTLGRGHDALLKDVYDMVMASADKGTAKHLRFAGSEWIKERISKRLTKWGY